MKVEAVKGWVLVKEGKGWKRYQDPKNPRHHRLLIDPQETLRPESEGSKIEWSSSTEATHYEAVDEETPDEDVSYIRTDPNSEVWQEDLFGLPDTAIGVSDTINWLRVYSRARSEAAAHLGKIHEEIYTHGNYYYVEPAHELGVSYENNYTEWATNPFTGNPWTVAEINALEAGVLGQSAQYCRFECSITTWYPIRCTQVYVLIDYTPFYVPPEVHRAEWPYYMAFAKRAFRFYYLFDQSTSSEEVDQLIEEFVQRGLNEEVLNQLAAIAKTKGELAKQED